MVLSHKKLKPFKTYDPIWPVGWFSCGFRVENLIKIVINITGLQTIWSIYVLRSARWEEYNGTIHSSTWESWKIQSLYFLEPTRVLLVRDEIKRRFLHLGSKWDDRFFFFAISMIKIWWWSLLYTLNNFGYQHTNKQIDSVL